MEKKLYKVNFEGSSKAYAGAKDYYEEGELVVFGIPLATDTLLSVYVDGNRISMDRYQEPFAFFSFYMPAKDVSVTCSSRNTMVKECD